MSSVFKVDTEQISSASGDINRVAGEIEAGVKAMMGKLNALQGTWQGSAAANFAGVSEDWRRTQDQVRDSLQRISLALGQAATQYGEVENANTRTFSQR
jgi:WXG100 family type VII secretion target